MKTILPCLTLVLVSRVALAADIAKDYPIQPVPFTQVHVEDEFWSPRLETNRRVTIPYALKMCEQTGRIDNFTFAGQRNQAKRGGTSADGLGKFRGYFFNDSDVYKVIEGASYSLATQPDPKLDACVDDLIAKIAAAQEEDGYLYTARTLCGPDYMPPGGKERWSDIGGGHELYNVGHLYEAAVAHHQATGKRSLLDVAVKNADLVCRVFGPGRNTHPSGHPEVEIGLCKLYRETRDAKYLALARFLLDARGHAEGHDLYGEYAQDHKPVIEQTEAVGHAVRAGYLYCGMADVAALDGDEAYVKAIDRLWDDVVTRKLYITGGIGARGGGEAFGAAYELPNRTAYAETCAAVANILWNQRMFLLHGDAKYVDVLERVLYNGFLAGASLEGDRFFYVNPLESTGGVVRQPWFDCACCPSNVLRFVPSVPGYVYAGRLTPVGEDVYVNLFIGGRAMVPLSKGEVQLRQETRYPWEGTVKITVDPSDSGADFAINVRIPGWARGQAVPGGLYHDLSLDSSRPSVALNGRPLNIELQKLDKGFVRIQRHWSTGDVVELGLPMPVRRVVADERVKDDAGRVALERGPIVFCAEGVDQKDHRVLDLVLADETPLKAEYRKDLLRGVVTLAGEARPVARNADGKPEAGAAQPFTAVPYYAWTHRGAGQMAVWPARDVSAARPLPGPTLAYRSKVTVSGGGPASALNDQLGPRSSADQTNPFFHWWPRKGTGEWVQYDFPSPQRVSAVEVYWFDDTGVGECRLPASWRLLAKVDGNWREVSHPSGYGVEKDQYNRTSFDPVMAEGLKLEVQLPEHFSAGIHEWRVE
jgi:DUF1680 family protein